MNWTALKNNTCLSLPKSTPTLSQNRPKKHNSDVIYIFIYLSYWMAVGFKQICRNGKNNVWIGTFLALSLMIYDVGIEGMKSGERLRAKGRKARGMVV